MTVRFWGLRPHAPYIEWTYYSSAQSTPFTTTARTELISHSGPGVSYSDNGTSGTVRWANGRLVVRAQIPSRQYAVDFTLRPELPGPYVRLRGPALDTVFAAPVASGRIAGRATLAGQPVNLEGWIGFHSYQHVTSVPAYSNRVFALVHGRTETWLVWGIDPNERTPDALPIDAAWKGVLVRVGKAGIRSCAARLHRGSWTRTSRPTLFWPKRLVVSCGSSRIEMRIERDQTVSQGDWTIGNYRSPVMTTKGAGYLDHWVANYLSG